MKITLEFEHPWELTNLIEKLNTFNLSEAKCAVNSETINKYYKQPSMFNETKVEEE